MTNLRDQLADAMDGLAPSNDAADARRYRWIREQMHLEGKAVIHVMPPGHDWSNDITPNGGDELDAAIDAAMGKS